MSDKINKTQVLERIKGYYNLKTNAKFASFLGIAPTTLSSWYSRNTFDLDIVYSKCAGISMDWLLTGEGSMLKQNVQNQRVYAEITENALIAKESVIIFNYMGNILSRLQEIAREEGITIGALERAIGASKGVLSRAISNGTDIQSKWIGIVVDNYPQYSTRWLLTGEGSMLRSDSVQHPVESTVASSDVVVLRLMDKLDDKEAENKQLQSELRSMEKELATLKAQYPEAVTNPPKGLGPAKDASTKKHSSPNADNATSATAL